MNINSLLSIAMALVISQGAGAVEKAFTPPEAWVRSICAKTGANPTLAIAERNENAKSWAAFIEDLAGVHQDPAVAHDLGVTGAAANPGPLPGLETNLISLAVTLYRAFGRGVVQRMLTVPQSAVVAIAGKTGADIQEVIAARNAATDDLLDFIESLVDKHFVDPD
jgi:hypothetical protein